MSRWIVVALALCVATRCLGITVVVGDGTVLHFHQQTANFGPLYGTFDQLGPMVLADPLLGCDNLSHDRLQGAVALILRGNCSFVQKVWHAQKAGAVGVIVGNSLDHVDAYVYMAKAELPAPDNLPGHLSDYITIPAQFVLHPDFVQMSKIITQTQGRATAQLSAADEIVSDYVDPNSNLKWFRLVSTILVFAPTFWCCLAAMFVIIRNAVQSHVNRSRRLRVLTSIPEVVFNDALLNKEDENWVTSNTCSICLEDFVHEVTVIKRLGCAHAFHPECIDVWLSKQSDKCPVCRESVLVSSEAGSHDSSCSCNSCFSRLFSRGDQIEYRQVVQMESPPQSPL